MWTEPDLGGWNCLGLVVFADLFGRIVLLLSLGRGQREGGLDVSLRWGWRGGMSGGRKERRGGSQTLAPVRKEEENKEVEILKLRLEFLKLEEIQLKMWIWVQSGPP